MGFGLLLDDFGIGYSSLSYLRCSPITEAQSDFLRGRGYPIQQGYLFLNTVPLDAFEQLLR